MRGIIMDIWDATRFGFVVSDKAETSPCQLVEKSKYDGEEAWARLKQLADMTQDEFAADCKLLKGYDYEEEESEGEEEESGEEGQDGEDGADEEEDHGGEHEGDDEDS